MARVTADELKVVYDSGLTDAVLEDIIDIANNLVTDILGTSGLSSDRLKNIERYLAAHFAAFREPQRGLVSAEWIASEAKIEFSSDFGRALDATHFGQTAAMLDTTGKLRQAGAKRATFRVTGPIAD